MSWIPTKKLVTPTQKLAEGSVHPVTVGMAVWRKVGGLTQRFRQVCLLSKPSCGDKSQLIGMGVERIDIVAFRLVLWLWPGFLSPESSKKGHPQCQVTQEISQVCVWVLRNEVPTQGL